MILHPPFEISARLCPALRIGDAWLSLVGTRDASDASRWPPRQKSHFVLDFPDGTSYEDPRMESGMGGFGSTVDVFESFLGYMSACAESLEFEEESPGSKGECSDLFPPAIHGWLADHQGEIECLACDLTDGRGIVRNELIEE